MSTVSVSLSLSFLSFPLSYRFRETALADATLLVPSQIKSIVALPLKERRALAIQCLEKILAVCKAHHSKLARAIETRISSAKEKNKGNSALDLMKFYSKVLGVEWDSEWTASLTKKEKSPAASKKRKPGPSKRTKPASQTEVISAVDIVETDKERKERLYGFAQDMLAMLEDVQRRILADEQ
jgi:hypothetical protein